MFNNLLTPFSPAHLPSPASAPDGYALSVLGGQFILASPGGSGPWMHVQAHKLISGNVPLTAFAIRADTLTGFKSGMYFKAQETI